MWICPKCHEIAKVQVRRVKLAGPSGVGPVLVMDVTCSHFPTCPFQIHTVANDDPHIVDSITEIAALAVRIPITAMFDGIT